MSEQSPKSPGAPAGLTEHTLEWVWALLRGAAAVARASPPGYRCTFALGPEGALRLVADGDAAAVLERRRDGAWELAAAVPRDFQPLFDLYLPVCAAAPGAPRAIGHLGQSLDGYVATRGGDSSYVNSPENILHLHRMRALCAAVVVGAGTIAADDPRLTTRLAAGGNPVRVVLDPRRRLAAGHRVFHDGVADTLVICAAEVAAAVPRSVGDAEIVGIPCDGGRLELAALLAALHARGLYSVFVEGGGTTVSRFLEAGALDRLQIAVAPLVMGQGRPGLRVPANEHIAQCLRPAHKVFAMGSDILFDCDLRHADAVVPSGVHAVLRRIY